MTSPSMASSKDFAPSGRSRRDGPFEVYDIETTTDLRNVYLVGWYDGNDYRYWESPLLPPEDPRSAISQFCTWYFLRRKCAPIYAHNGGNFDHLYVLKWLLHHELTSQIEIIPTQSSILLMKVTVEGVTYEFRDSMRLMVGGLDSLAKTLLGVGKVDNVNYDTLHQDPIRYDYLKRDCVALFDCIVRFRETVRQGLGGSMGLTAAATAINTIKTGYLAHSIKHVSPENERLIRMGYYGGRTEVFHRGGKFNVKEPLQCYDVNSMYVWALGQPLPTKEHHETDGLPNLNLDGFCTATVDTRGADNLARKYPVLPFRGKNKLLFPSGVFQGVWTTEELRLAVRHGYEIIGGGKCLYFRLESIFRRYVETLYRLRDKTRPGYDETLSRIAKLLGNSSYGKFGTNRERELIHVRPKLDDVVSKGMMPLQGPLELPVYVESVETDADYVLPHLAAWVTSLARVRLLEFIYQCDPWRVYYCDTDSVYTCAELGNSTALGGMKREYSDIVEAEFIQPKVYRLRHANGHETIRAKGFSEFAKGFAGNFESLKAHDSIQCSAMSKMRTVLRGDFGLIMRRKRIHENAEDKRQFLKDGSSIPLQVKDETQESQES
jgi:DNA polymerase type B, organellar and viral